MFPFLNPMMLGGGTPAVPAPNVSELFSKTLYTGNASSSRNIITNTDLLTKGGFAWFKSRSETGSNVIVDTDRGVGRGWRTDVNAAEVSGSSVLAAFLSNGLTIGNYSQVNTTAVTYEVLSFAKHARFVHTAAFTGDGAAEGQAIAMPLGMAPGMVIVKELSTTTGATVWHRSFPADTVATLSSNLTPATSADITVSGGVVRVNGGCNTSGGAYQMYVFAHDAAADGIIQCSNVAGGATVDLGWRPQFVLWKPTNSVADWQMYDTLRGIGPGTADKRLLANSNAAEATVSAIDLTVTGFTNTAHAASINVAFVAIREA